VNKFQVQIIPELLNLECNVRAINCFSFWDSKNRANFFSLNPRSPFQFKYFVRKEIEDPPKIATFRFSNLSYLRGKWFYHNKKGPLTLKFTIEENENLFLVNSLYHRLFVKVGCLEPTGNILTDFITYKLEQVGMSYQVGSAGNIKGKTFLFFGGGYNFKTTLMSLILQNGGYYIGEEFFLLKGNNVFATIPNSHRFDFRNSHRSLFKFEINKKRMEVSEYSYVIFLYYSDKDEIKEINLSEANHHLQLYHHTANTRYYKHFKTRDFLLGKKKKEKQILRNTDARYYLCYFTDIKKVFNFINKK